MKQSTRSRVSRSAGTLILATLGIALPSWADPIAQMRQCRLLTEVALKAACYDAITLPPTTAAATNPAAGPNATAPGAAAARPAPAAISTSPGAAAAAAAGFGLPVPAAAPVSAGSVVAGALESTIPGVFEGWQPQSRIRLANGQVWQVTDGSEGTYTRRDPKVRISRGSLGSFFMQIEGIAQTPRVRRVE